MSWRPALCLNKLREQVDAAFPDRPQHMDGMLGDTAHSARKSDHNPNDAGVVCAWDITRDDRFTDALAEDVRKLGAAGDKRVKYVIFKGRIAGPATKGWAWRPYSGENKHNGHIHLSVSGDKRVYDRTTAWPVLIRSAPSAKEWDEMASKEEIRAVVAEELAKAVKTLHDDHVVLLRGTPNHPYNLTSIGKKVVG